MIFEKVPLQRLFKVNTLFNPLSGLGKIKVG